MTRAQRKERSGTQLRFSESLAVRHSLEACLTSVDDDDWDDLECEAAKEVWLPSPELSRFLDAKAALVEAGYRIVTARVFQEHPLWLFIMDSSKAPRIESRVELLRHIRDALWEIGLRYSDGDAVVHACGRNRLQFSILWRIPAPTVEREIAWERWPLQELLNQLS